MFESIVNFLSPAAPPNSVQREAVAAAPASKTMTRRTRSSLESTSAPPITVAIDMEPEAFDHAHDPIGVDFSGPLLTPEASRSETSSNLDLVPGDEKPITRRRSTRVTRMSLRGLENMREMEEDNKIEDVEPSSTSIDAKNRTVSGETLINSIVESRASQSSLKNDHSSATINGHSWSQITLLRENTETDENPHLATPDSKRSEESEEAPRRRSLRAQPATEQTPDSTMEEAAKSANKPERTSPPRRSARLSLVTRATEVLDRAASVLGKRSRDAMEKAVLKRRASLRPRHSLPANESMASSSSSQLPDAKKRRVSEGDLLSKKLEVEADETEKGEKPNSAVPQFRTKRWLDQGLYTGQTRDYDARLNEANNKIRAAKRKAPFEPQRKLLPLPMFSGERLLKNGRDFKLPFDIFSPLPPGQPKPDEWKKVNRNVFVGDAASFWRENKKIELSTCLCDEETGCDDNCQNRFMFYECDSSNCRIGPNCGNRSFEELKQRSKAGGKYNIGVEVIKTADRGYGVRSNRTFEPNQVIVEYTGEIITQNECEKRMRTVYKNNECYYLMYFDQNMIIDATRGSIARFVNHSCAPNCRMEKWTVGGKPRMALFAGDRGIMTGEELTYDYNFDPYSQKNVQQCRCGAPTCRGVLGPRPKERELRESKAEQKKGAQQKKSKNALAGTKRKLSNVLDESTSALNKKRKVMANNSVKKTFSKAVSKAKSALNNKKKAPVQVKKNVTVTKITRNSTSATTKSRKTISKSKVTKVATTAKTSSKGKAQQAASQSKKKTTATQTKAASKPVSASEKVRIRFKATARRSTSFKKGTQTLKLKSPANKKVATPGKKTPSKTPTKDTPNRSPSQNGSIRNKAASTKASK
ncbi:hypothetical protein UA08_01973 [Talaromyces atroroseus]|uniref:Histone-lysine N-methyltransferase ASH1L n=1 Tax=Talaromyces atroroseus TaxID=1441469 RepID=A0A1Q5QAJ4_TALAT|nr:hypothetical protein UA08_01973 [Talaromyces atroroseus]OKL62954.1 hypothetical protein UA08_01973 [Talaromyces atroroseus]